MRTKEPMGNGGPPRRRGRSGPVLPLAVSGLVLLAVLMLAQLGTRVRAAGVGGAGVGNGGIILQSGVTNGVLWPNTPWTNAINTNTTVTNPTRFSVPDNTKEVILETTFQGTAAGVGASNVVITVGQSVNGGMDPTNIEAAATWSVPMNGTTQVCALTNHGSYTVGGANPFWYIISIKHTQTNAGCLLTNFTVRAYAK